MCRSIKTLRSQAEVTDDEVAAAALQFVRKVSGYRRPSRANAAAFESAVAEVAASTTRLLEAVGSPVSTGDSPAGPVSSPSTLPGCGSASSAPTA